MVFHSKSSIESPNCRQEINYALKKRKGILSVYLEGVELTNGLDMQLSPFQSTFLYQYDDLDKFYENLFETKILKICRGKNSSQYINSNDMQKYKTIMPVEFIFKLTGRGTVLVGQIVKGIISIGDAVIINNKQGIVAAIECNRKLLNFADSSDKEISVLLKNIKKCDVSEGDILYVI